MSARRPLYPHHWNESSTCIPRPGHRHERIFLSHKFAVASESLDDLRSLLSVYASSATSISALLLRVRRGELSSIGNGDSPSATLWRMTALYYDAVRHIPHFRRGGHYGGNEGVDAAPWGLRWEEDRKDLRQWLRSHKAGQSTRFSFFSDLTADLPSSDALFNERSQLFSFAQVNAMLE